MVVASDCPTPLNAFASARKSFQRRTESVPDPAAPATQARNRPSSGNFAKECCLLSSSSWFVAEQPRFDLAL